MPRDPRRLPLLGSCLSLDFTNTCELNSRTGEHTEFLQDYADLLAWAEHAGALTAEQTLDLQQRAIAEPEAAGSVYQRAIGFRACLNAIFTAVVTGGDQDAAALAGFNAVVRESLSEIALAEAEQGFRVTWAGRHIQDLNSVLWVIAYDAYDLLLHGDTSRVGRCEGCGWLYYDTTRNRSRRWCDMAVCGNRSKARRHYRRSRGGQK